MGWGGGGGEVGVGVGGGVGRRYVCDHGRVVSYPNISLLLSSSSFLRKK